MFCSLLVNEFLSNANAVVVLITGLIGLVSAGVGAFFAIKNFINLNKEKNMKEIWAMIVNMADAAMKQAEASALKGADKKQMVIDAVKAGCKSEGLNIDAFIDQLSSYIDQTIAFVNDMQATNQENK